MYVKDILLSCSTISYLSRHMNHALTKIDFMDLPVT